MTGTTIALGLATIADRKRTRELERDLAHVHRGPCGGWHYDDRRDRRRFCHACISLGVPRDVTPP